MGIDLDCCDQEFSCPYNTWNEVRMECIYATFRYLENLEKRLKPNDRIEMQTEFLHSILKLKPMLTESVNSFLSQFCRNDILIDTFISLDIYGLYSLINKSDCEGFYSPGNAFDIVLLLDKINPYMTNEIVAELMPSIISLFKKSVESKISILIS